MPAHVLAIRHAYRDNQVLEWRASLLGKLAHCQRIRTHPSGDGNGDDSLLDLRDCVGDSDGDGRGSTLPVGGGKMPSVLERPMITWLTI